MKIIEQVKAAKGKVAYTLFGVPEEDTVRYGISVRSELFGEPEEKTVKDITSEQELARKLFFTLADNLVLPYTLDEVVEEYISAVFTA